MSNINYGRPYCRLSLVSQFYVPYIQFPPFNATLCVSLRFPCPKISVLNRPGAPQGRWKYSQENRTGHDRTGPLAVVRSRAKHQGDSQARLGPRRPTR